MLILLSDAALDVLDDSGADSFELCHSHATADLDRIMALYAGLDRQYPGLHLVVADTACVLISEAVRQQFSSLLALFEGQDTPSLPTGDAASLALDPDLQQWLAGIQVKAIAPTFLGTHYPPLLR